MHDFNYKDFPEKLLTMEIVALMLDIRESKGRQLLLSKVKPDLLDAMLDDSLMKSTVSSNRIDGIATTDTRMRQIVSDGMAPCSHDERKIAGYISVLDVIRKQPENVDLTPATICRMHRELFLDVPGVKGGEWKSDDVTLRDETSGFSFPTVSAKDTAAAVVDLCTAYNAAVKRRAYDPLLLTALFALDFLSIYPFEDGNGRVSRLLTNLLLSRSGYLVDNYVSIDDFIERSKKTYYDTLHTGSVGWHDNKHDPRPFVMYWLGVVLKAYQGLDGRIGDMTRRGLSKGDRIREMFKVRIGKITKRDILNACPDISETTAEVTLKSMLDSGEIRKIGGGRSTAYVAAE